MGAKEQPTMSTTDDGQGGKTFVIQESDHKVVNEKPQPQDSFKLGIALFMEFLGTMLFQLFGGAPFATGVNGGVMNGLLLIVIVWMTAEWSGGHVNPAVTLGLLLSGNVEVLTAIFYWIAQLSGALIGAVL